MKSHLTNIVTIINPMAGSDSDILALLAKATTKYEVTNEVFVSQSPNDVIKLTKKALRKKPDAVIVYGGDGTVVDVASVLYRAQVPLIIIPGGTANVIAKELKIPVDTEEALKILGRKPKNVEINIARFGKQTMMLRIEVGILAQMVKEANNSQLKEKIGELAYSVTALKETLNAQVSHYTVTVDGVKHKIDGVGMTIANIGNIGLPGISLQEKIDPTDGLLDVLVLQSSDIATLIKMASSTFIGTEKPFALKHWQGKNIRVSITPKQTLVSDDKIFEASRFMVKTQSQNLTILV